MKKLTKILTVLTLLFSIFASLGFGAKEVMAANDTATVTLHKKMMNELPSPLLQNTGDIDSRFDAYEYYTDGVEFKVYDVSAAFYTARAGGATVDAALTAAQGVDLTALTPVDTQTTGNTGLANFTLNKFDASDRHAVYLFVETPKAGVTVAANMILMFPVYRMNIDGTYTDVELEDIHLYPKNIVSKGDLEVIKRGTADNALLNGAEFIIQSNQTNRYLSGVANGYFTWSDDAADAFKFQTGRTYGIGSTDITDAAGADGILNISGLIPGSYKLIETNAPTNAAIIDAENNKDFTIVPGATSATSFTVKNDTIITDKDIVGEKRDYEVGDLIPYEINVNIPLGIGDTFVNENNETVYKHINMTITDAPDVGLQFNNDLVLTAGTTAITIDPSWLNTSGNGFVLTIPASALAAYGGQTLNLAYHMFLDDEANPDVAYDNVATVHTDKLTTQDGGPEVFTGGKRFIKKDKDAQNHNLAGAIFVVRDGNGNDAKYLAIDTATKEVSWVADEADATKFTTGADGLIDIRGLEYGTYYLEEIQAPEDYVELEDLIEFDVDKGTYGAPEDLVDPAIVVNIRKGRLPSTGGSGIIGVVSLGAVLIATTGGYYIKRRKDA